MHNLYILLLTGILFWLMPVNVFSQNTKTPGNNSSTQYTMLLNHAEYQLLTGSIIDGISKYKGNIELATNVKYNNGEISWELSSPDKLVFDVINLYLAQKSVDILKSVDIGKASASEKNTIASLRSLAIKLDDAIKNPILKLTQISGILTKDSLHFYVQTTDDKRKIIKSTPNHIRLDSLVTKHVYIEGYVKENDIIDAVKIAILKKNTLELFVMSHCPYGIEAIKYITESAAFKQSKFNFEIHYLFTSSNATFTSLHGEPEIIENLVQITIRDKFPTYFNDYLELRIKSPDEPWEILINNLGGDKELLKQIKNRITLKRDIIARSEYDYMLSNYNIIYTSPTYIWENKIVYGLIEIPWFENASDTETGKCGG